MTQEVDFNVDHEGRDLGEEDGTFGRPHAASWCGGGVFGTVGWGVQCLQPYSQSLLGKGEFLVLDL